jgi:hypothetical protein
MQGSVDPAIKDSLRETVVNASGELYRLRDERAEFRARLFISARQLARSEEKWH